MSWTGAFPRRWLAVDTGGPERLRAGALAADVDALIVVGPVREAAPFIAFARDRSPRRRLFCAVASVGVASRDDDFDAFGATPPDGVLLTACRGRADLQQLSVRLAVAEARAGIESGRIVILASVAQTPDAIFGLGGLMGASRRLAGLVFDPAALPRAMGSGFDPGGMAAGAARSLVVFAAAAAGVPALVLVPPHPATSVAGFDTFCVSMRGEGFAGVIAVAPDQARRSAAIFGRDPF